MPSSPDLWSRGFFPSPRALGSGIKGSACNGCLTLVDCVVPLQLPPSVLESNLPTDPMCGLWLKPLRLSIAGCLCSVMSIAVSSIIEGRNSVRWLCALELAFPVPATSNESPPELKRWMTLLRLRIRPVRISTFSTSESESNSSDAGQLSCELGLSPCGPSSSLGS